MDIYKDAAKSSVRPPSIFSNMDSFLQVGTPHANHALVLYSESVATLMQKDAPSQSQPSTPPTNIFAFICLFFFGSVSWNKRGRKQFSKARQERKRKRNNALHLQLIGLQRRTNDIYADTCQQIVRALWTDGRTDVRYSKGEEKKEGQQYLQKLLLFRITRTVSELIKLLFIRVIKIYMPY